MAKKGLSIGILSFFLFIQLHAQQTFNTLGVNASGSGGTLSLSVGQIVYQTSTGINGFIVEGVNQPYEISVVTSIKEVNNLSHVVKVFQDPVGNYIVLKIDETNELNIKLLSYQLFDVNGKLLQYDKLTDKQIYINTANLVPSTYFLKVIYKNKAIKTFKIIKN